MVYGKMCKYFLVVITVVLTQSTICTGDTDQRNERSKPGGLFGSNWGFTPSKRFLSLFTVVTWGQGQCTAPSGEYGNCVPNNECLPRGGIPGGPCAAGYGMCCVFMQSCGGIARENGTYFVNPNHPDAYEGTGSCQLTIMKTHPDICQIRLDLDNFAISQPEPINHICNADQFLVSGGSPAPSICGTSHGEHIYCAMCYLNGWLSCYNSTITNSPIECFDAQPIGGAGVYIDAGLGQSNPITVTVITSGPAFPRTWRIRVSQIPCGSISKADQGCLQWYTGVYGRVKSFNFDTKTGRQLSNQDYSICMRTERNFCGIQYTACPDPSNNRSRSFTISGNSNSIVNSMVGSGTQGTPNSCTNDWLLIGCARVTDRIPVPNTCEDRICGGTFNAEVSTLERTVQSSVRPFRLSFHTDLIEAPNDIDNRGFCLDYTQQPCTNG